MYANKLGGNTVFEILNNKNIIKKWSSHYNYIDFSDTIKIRITEYIELLEPEICTDGSFYNSRTNEDLGQSFTYRIYFYKDNAKLAIPEIVPNPSDIIYISNNQ